jgi:hypothetical protein
MIRPTPISASRLRSLNRGLCVVGAALCSLAAILVWRGHNGAVALLAWAASLACSVALKTPRRTTHRLERNDWLILAAILAVAAFFRLYRIASVPSGPWIDELANAADAINLASGHSFAPFGTTPLFAIGPEWVHTSNLYLYASYLLLWVSGFSQLGLKLISALPGIAAPPITYLLGRRFLRRPAAMLAAAWLAASQWHVTASRWGWNQVLATTLVIAMFARLYEGAKRSDRRAFLVAGVIGGLSLYTYASAWLGVLGALGFLLLRRTTFSRRVAGATVFAAGVLQAALPLLVFSACQSAGFAARAHEMSILPLLSHGDLRPLAANFVAYGSMFWIHGDRNPRHDLPGAPMLDPLVGLLFAIGIAAALRRWRRIESRLLLVWLGAGLLGGILSLPDSAPNSYRVGLIAPACMLIAALGWRELAARLHVGRWRYLLRREVLAAVAAILLSSAAAFLAYFVTRPASRECWFAVKEGAYCGVLRKASDRLLAGGGTVLFDRSLEMITTRLQFDVLQRRERPSARWRWVDGSRIRPGELSTSVLLLAPQRWPDLLPQLRSLPHVMLRSPFGDDIAVMVSSDASLIARAAGAQR